MKFGWCLATGSVDPRKGFSLTADKDTTHAKSTKEREDAAPDLVERNFTADQPNQLWVADITYVPTWAGFLYLSVVLDAFSRRIVGWAMANHLKTELVLDALEMALEQRRPDEVIHHSDHGSQYISLAFGKRCGEMGVRPSMGSVGDAYDNAMAESFFATLECELLNRRRFRTQTEARHIPFHRRLVQPPPASLCARQPVTPGLRAYHAGSGLILKPTTVHRNGSTPHRNGATPIERVKVDLRLPLPLRIAIGGLRWPLLDFGWCSRRSLILVGPTHEGRAAASSNISRREYQGSTG